MLKMLLSSPAVAALEVEATDAAGAGGRGRA